MYTYMLRRNWETECANRILKCDFFKFHIRKEFFVVKNSKIRIYFHIRNKFTQKLFKIVVFNTTAKMRIFAIFCDKRFCANSAKIF